jgi:hypothetical protein
MSAYQQYAACLPLKDSNMAGYGLPYVARTSNMVKLASLSGMM